MRHAVQRPIIPGFGLAPGLEARIDGLGGYGSGVAAQDLTSSDDRPLGLVGQGGTGGSARHE